MLSGIVKFLLVASITVRAALQSPQDLHQKYYDIFPSGNRNAASHRWATYLLDRSEEMTEVTFRAMFSSFCAVSGSPVNPMPQKRWKMTLKQVTGEDMTGMMYFCCAPCVCDTQDMIKVDTKTVTTKDGPKKYHFVVIGNPCLHTEALTQTWADPFNGVETSIARSAPDVKCSAGELEKATLSDHGHIILSMFFEENSPGHATAGGEGFTDSKELEAYCKRRAEDGYASGMGKIFRKVALISPLGDLFTTFVNSSTTVSTSSTASTTTSTTKSTTTSTTTTSSTSSKTTTSIMGQGTTQSITASTTALTTTGSFREPQREATSDTDNGISSNAKTSAGNLTIFNCFLAAVILTMKSTP